MRVNTAVTDPGIEELIGRIDDKYEILIEQGLQALSDPGLHPIRVELDADIADAGLGSGDALNFPQYPFTVIVQRTREQLAFRVERHLVGTLRRTEHRDHDADDGDRHADGGRHRDAQAGTVPSIRLTRFSGRRRGQCYASCSRVIWTAGG